MDFEVEGRDTQLDSSYPHLMLDKYSKWEHNSVLLAASFQSIWYLICSKKGQDNTVMVWERAGR